MSYRKKRKSKELRSLHKIENILDNYNKQHTKVEIKPVEPIIHKAKEKLWYESIVMSDHAYLRSSERFNMDKVKALPYFRSVLSKARKIGITVDKDGKENILYASGRIAVHVSLDLKVIVSVNKHESVTYEPMKRIFIEIHAKELRKLNKRKNTCSRRLEETILESNIKIAELKLRIHKTKSPSVKISCAANIKAIEIYIDELKEEIRNIQDNIRQLSRSMVAVV
ncbi:hypothetical protein [Metabacillus fastidiosus]|uniref:hypothetical protein n=1 Tax=Metabacillus fastidiosus TaxID=1458 RepID=UPI003D29B7D5